MNQANRPIPYADNLDESLSTLNTRHGVFYPTGHVVVCYASTEQLGKAWHDSWQGAISDDGTAVLRADQMRYVCDRSDEEATTIGTIVGAELKQVEILRQIADQGGEFLILNDGRIDVDRLHAILQKHRPLKALRYGLLTIEELIEEDQSAIVDNPMGQNERARDLG